ncbi:restriction endonuclease subunit S [uncultured Ruminococcus sp.]|uniref:restriction endonuclease subunit S n=1 Tax=uncultured Ruminococcus sp. TaxID=165186 RepID=UPI0026775D87|nr:restriction endonuclease subunit S [uncultured Ruminococcus sp.]
MTAQQLKNSILQLAVQGKLVPQDSSDEPASVLLQRIKAEKQELIKAGKIKKDKKSSEIFRGASRNLPYTFCEQIGKEVKDISDEIPFDIPESWCWCRLDSIFYHNTGKALNSSKTQGTKMQYITTSNLYWNKFELDKLKEMPFTENEIEKCTVSKGDLLVCEGGDIGRAAIWNYDYPMRIQNHIHRIRPYLQVDMYFYYYVFYLYKSAGLIGGKGIGIQGLSTNALGSLFIPLPPLAEQRRIVEKIEQLLPFIEKYEQAETQLTTLNTTFPEMLKKSILQEAVQGKLVPQNPDDGPASVLLERIRAEKQKLIKAGKIKKSKHESVIITRDKIPYEILDGKERCIADEVPFEIPESWCWCRWGNLSESIQYGYNAPAKEHGRIKMVRISDIQDNAVLWDTVPFCNIDEKSIETYLLKPNDILFARTGGTVGKSYLVRNVPEDAIYAGYLIRTRYSANLLPEYLKFFMESELYWFQLRNGTIATAQPNCNGKTLANMLVPIPPFAEQKRIVAKIEELMQYCDKLK